MTNQQDQESEFSAIDTIDCPNCGTEAMMETVHATGEENIQCHACGYSRRFAIVNGSYELKEIKGYGAYKVKMVGSDRWECGSFTHYGAAEEFERLIKNIDNNVAFASYSQYISQKIQETIVTNKLDK